jgi:hypothetical protein
VLATLSRPKDYIIAPDIAEDTVALKTAKFSSKLRFYKVVLEVYTLQMVQAPKEDGLNLSKYDDLIEDAQGILNGLQKWQINHVSRNLNGAAH